MFKRIWILLTVTLVLLLVSTAVLADDPGFPWKDHAKPFGNLFNNLIDNHQQSKLVRNGMLQGFVYVQFTGEDEGVPVAERADCENPTLDCRVGWKVKGIPFSATLVSKGPRTWLVDETLLPNSGNYVHFHWNGKPKKPCGLTVGQEYDGFLLQRTAVTKFLWLGGNSSNGHGGHLVTPGIDLHSNIVTEWDGNSGGGGGHDEDEGDCGGHDDGGSGGPPDGSGEPGGSGEEPGGSGGPGDSGGPGGSGGHGGSGGCSGHEDGEDEGCSGHSSLEAATTTAAMEFAPGMQMVVKTRAIGRFSQ